MLVSQGKVLSLGNEGSMAVIVYVSIFPQLCFICVHMPISGPSSLVQFLYIPATVRQPVCRTEARSVDWIWIVLGYCNGFCEGDLFYFLWKCRPW